MCCHRQRSGRLQPARTSNPNTNKNREPTLNTNREARPGRMRRGPLRSRVSSRQHVGRTLTVRRAAARLAPNREPRTENREPNLNTNREARPGRMRRGPLRSRVSSRQHVGRTLTVRRAAVRLAPNREPRTENREPNLNTNQEARPGRMRRGPLRSRVSSRQHVGRTLTVRRAAARLAPNREPRTENREPNLNTNREASTEKREPQDSVSVHFPFLILSQPSSRRLISFSNPRSVGR